MNDAVSECEKMRRMVRQRYTLSCRSARPCREGDRETHLRAGRMRQARSRGPIQHSRRSGRWSGQWQSCLPLSGVDVIRICCGRKLLGLPGLTRRSSLLATNRIVVGVTSGITATDEQTIETRSLRVIDTVTYGKLSYRMCDTAAMKSVSVLVMLL